MLSTYLVDYIHGESPLIGVIASSPFAIKVECSSEVWKRSMQTSKLYMSTELVLTLARPEGLETPTSGQGGFQPPRAVSLDVVGQAIQMPSSYCLVASRFPLHQTY